VRRRGQGHEWRGREGVTKVRGTTPAGPESSRGDRGAGRHKTSVSVNGSALGSKLWRPGRRSRRRRGNSAAGVFERKVRRARAGDESGRLSVGETPCRANLARGVWDETSPRGTGRSKPSRAWETLWAEQRQVGNPADEWTPCTEVAMEEETPGKVPNDCGRSAGPRQEKTLKRK
jgi:hypothetical protein